MPESTQTRALVRTTRWLTPGESSVQFHLVETGALRQLDSYVSGMPLEYVESPIRENLFEIAQNKGLADTDSDHIRALLTVLWVDAHGIQVDAQHSGISADFSASVF